MILRTSPLRWLWLLFIASMASLPTDGMAASTAYVATTQNLDLNRLQLVVVASPELKARLYDRAMTLFTKAGLPLPASDESRLPTATLTLTLDPHPLGEACPGKVLYAPSLSLTEPVIIPRNSVVMNDISWLSGTDRRIGEPVGSSQLETDLENVVQQFITDYKTANPGWQSQETPLPPKRPRTEPSSPVTPEAQDGRTDSGLKDLAVSRLSLSVMAGQATDSLTTRAIHQLTEAGFRISPERNSHGVVTIGVELIQQSIHDQCPGKVLYERGLYLVEQVQIKRNPRVLLWTDTWLREAVQIVPPVPIQQLESDQDALIQQLINSFQRN